MRRSRARVRQLRDALPLVARRRDRGQLVPRLLRLRLRPRPLRHRPDDPRGTASSARCRAGWARYRCGHQDLVQLFAGRRLRVAGNRFGIDPGGGAQLYLTNSVDYATIVNNVFVVGTDPRVPGYRARMGIVLGSNRSRRLPHYAKILNNTILTGYRRRDWLRGVTADELALRRRATLEAAGRREQRDRVAGDARSASASPHGSSPGDVVVPRPRLLAARRTTSVGSAGVALARLAGDRPSALIDVANRDLRPGDPTRRAAGAAASRTSARSSTVPPARTAPRPLSCSTWKTAPTGSSSTASRPTSGMSIGPARSRPAEPLGAAFGLVGVGDREDRRPVGRHAGVLHRRRDLQDPGDAPPVDLQDAVDPSASPIGASSTSQPKTLLVEGGRLGRVVRLADPFQLSVPGSFASSAPMCSPRLPDAENGAGRILRDRHPTRVEDVERLREDGAAGPANLLSCRVGVVARDIGRPMSRPPSWPGGGGLRRRRSSRSG